MNAIDALELSTWHFAVAARAESAARRRLKLLGDEGVRRRYLAARTHPTGTIFEAWLSGAREPMRTGLQQVVADMLGSHQQGHLRWALGRWPRGDASVGIALNGERSELSLGLIAPIPPTRIGLSEGPLPFPKEVVSQLKALHGISRSAGLLGFRMAFFDQRLHSLRCRWPVQATTLGPLMAELGLDTVHQEYVEPAIAGLTEGSKAAHQLVLEIPWTPAPDSGCIVEIGPVGAARAIGLVDALMGASQAHDITHLAETLRTKRFFRLRLETSKDAVTAITTLAGARTQDLAQPW